ncbi:auxilin-related protein 2 isoform X2 [Diospyros lotus]|uniref:auxilin-related protein 2 isoform X2 n=1 Tax=Diospyros lotus TaxID=55363 RepID=UPI00225866A5|nr:auxilin-related protein 2 isoform X2 [Diospyros lotus]
MDDFSTLARDFGYRPQGKSAPMAPPKTTGGSDGADRRARPSSASFRDDRDGLLFNDVFGGPPRYTSSNNAKPASSVADFDYDSIFKSSSASDSKNRSSSPVYDKPVYDEDIFDGLPGLKSKSTTSSKVNYDENIFASISSPQNSNQSAAFDDLLGNLGRTEKPEPRNNKSSRGLDDLIPGLADSSPPRSSRSFSESSRPQRSTASSVRPNSDIMEDPFVVLESTSTPAASSSAPVTDPLEEISKIGNSGSTKVSNSTVGGPIFEDIDPLDDFGNSIPTFSSETNNRAREESPSRMGSRKGRVETSNTETFASSSFRDSESHSQKMSADNFQESDRAMFDMPGVPTDLRKPVGQTNSPSFVNANFSEKNSQADVSPGSEDHVEPSDDVWLTVTEIPLFTQPMSAPPPSRPPPPIPARASKSEAGLFTSNARKKGYEFSSSSHSSQYSQSPKTTRPPVKSSTVSPIDELEEFAMGRSRNNVDDYANIHSGEEANAYSSAAASAAAMKEAMEKAEAKFKHAKEVREREYAKAARSKEAVYSEKDQEAMQDDQEREFRENQERLDRERRQKEEEEREKRRLEKERERAREIEREKAKQAVERATREARERAAVEARERAAAEARLRTERAAVQRAQAEARERAATDARERAEKVAAEARERANAEAREKEVREKAAAARAEAEARRRAERAAVERAAAEARERAAAAARLNQQKNDNDLESFFSMGSRPSSAPRPRFQDPVSDPQFQNKGVPEGGRRTSSVNMSSNMRKASSTVNIVDDLSSIFGAPPSSGDFQEVEGETEERRRARLERHQRTQERAAKALAEKNQRDLQAQKDQEERHRIAEALDFEIKRWSAGKEGNLRALLSTLQYVLWPECGWQPVSLTDLITGASVKKVYRKATLCIHPDKVQQKGATLQQKYIAEKVFDLLKEAWNKFNSEELF